MRTLLILLAASAITQSPELVVQTGHTGKILDMAFSTDATMIATASSDKTIKIWDFATGKEIRTLKGHGGEVTRVRFTPDGKKLYSGCIDGKLRIWEVATGKLAGSMKTGGWMFSVLPDGKVMTGKDNSTMAIWDTHDGKFVKRLDCKFYRGFEVSPDGKTLAAPVEFYGDFRGMLLWDIQANNERIKIKDSYQPSSLASFSPDGKMVANAGAWGVDFFYTTTSERAGKVKFSDMDGFTAMAWNADGSVVALCSEGFLRLVSTENWSELYSAEFSEIGSVAFSPDGTQLVFGLGGNFAILDARTIVEVGKQRRFLSDHSDKVTAMIFSHDGKTIATGDAAGIVKLWDVESEKEKQSLKLPVPAQHMAFTPDGGALVCGGREKVIFRDLKTQKEVWNHRTADDYDWVYWVAVSHDGKKVAVSRSKNILVHDSEKGAVLSSHPAASATSSTFMEDDTLLTASYERDAFKFYSRKTGLPIFDIPQKENSEYPHWTSDAKFLVRGETSGNASSFQVVDLKSGKTVSNVKVANVESHYYTRSRTTKLYSLCSDKTFLKVWDLLEGKQTMEISNFVSSSTWFEVNHDGTVVAAVSGTSVEVWKKGKLANPVAMPEARHVRGCQAQVRNAKFSPDGKSLVISAGGATRIIDPASGKEIFSIKGTPHISFKPDGTQILASYITGKLVVYDARTGKIVCGEAPRELGDDEGEYDPFYGEFGEFCNDGKRIVCGNSSGAIKIVDGGTLEEVESMRGRFSTLASMPSTFNVAAVSRDGKYLAYDCEFALLVYDLTDGEEIHSFDYDGNFPGITFSPDGKRLATGYGASVVIYDISTGESTALKGHTDSVSEVAYSNDGKLLASGGTDNLIIVWDMVTMKELMRLEGHTSDINFLSFDADGKRLVSAAYDATVRFWDLKTKKEMMSFISMENSNWAVVTPEGRFDGTADGLKQMHWVQNNQPVPLESFFEQFYTPRLFAQVMAGTVEPVKGVDISKGITLPPVVSIASPKPGETFSSDSVEVTVEATDRGGGVSEIRLYQNGKLVSEDQRGIAVKPKSGGKITKSYKILLVSGANEISATAFSGDRVESSPCSIKIILRALEASVDLHLIAIGINDYKNPKYKLNYGKPDAEAFAASIEAKGKGIFKHMNKQLLFDKDATKESIEAAFEKVVKEAKPQDGFVFYYAGHGVMSGGDAGTPDFFLIPHDVTKLYGDDEMLANRAISSKRLKELCTNIKAQKQLIVLDACQSGGAVDTFAMRGAAEEKAIVQLARSAGVVVIAATGQEQFATEFKELGHGVFTYALIKALDGEADGAPKDGKVTVKEIEAYLNEKVPELTAQYRGTAQYPNSYARGQDFPVGVMK